MSAQLPGEFVVLTERQRLLVRAYRDGHATMGAVDDGLPAEYAADPELRAAWVDGREDAEIEEANR